ncbi:MAG: S46 family peptidase [Flavobacteriales bacterium]
MKKNAAIFIFCFGVFTCRADEGMWLPSLLKSLNESQMVSKGLKISIDELYSANKSSLKDAIVLFGGGCTGEIISYEGLLFTNHHCGLSQIQYHSSVEHDYLKNGFWSTDRTKELSCPGLTVSIITKMEDVTARVMQGVDLSTNEGGRKLQANIVEVEKEAAQGEKYVAEVKPFNYGNAFYLIVKEVFKDIRLVGAPPQAVGNYGGDTDNWMWPRHTGDFSIFRIYVNKNNEPATYSADNVPYKPRYAFSINTDGVKEGDFTMVYGFPGRTQQFLTSQAIEYTQKYGNPAKISMRDKALEIIDAAMLSSDKIRIQYAAKQSRISNSHKKWKGELIGLTRLNVIDQKKSLESEFKSRLYKDAILNSKYGNVLENLDNLYKSGLHMLVAGDYFGELVGSGPEMLKFTYGFQKFMDAFTKGLEAEDLAKQKEKLTAYIKSFFKNMNEPTDRNLFAGLMAVYISGTDSLLVPSYVHGLGEKYKNNWVEAANDIYSKSVFTQPDKLIAQIEKFGKSTLTAWDKDPLMIFCKKLYENYRDHIEPSVSEFYSSEQYYMHRFVEAYAKVFPEKKIWYDANSTLRLTYGKVEGSKPRDGMIYDYYSSTTGVLEKNYSGNPDYKLPDALVKLLVRKDFGNYGSNGELRTCFTASNHTTGGNSGSPVLNGYGELVGINFDRSWESTMSDLYFSGDLCRNIAVDIRYVLFIIDKLGGAGYLLSEMKLVSAVSKAEQFKKDNMARIKDLNEQLMVSPDNPALLVQRAETYIQLEMFDDARLSARAALDSKERYLPAVLILSKAHVGKKEYAAAIKALDSYLKKDNRNVEVLIEKARICFLNNAYEDVLKVIGLLDVEYVNESGEVLLLKAKALFMLGRKAEACALFERAKKKGAEVPGYYSETCN